MARSKFPTSNPMLVAVASLGVTFLLSTQTHALSNEVSIQTRPLSNECVDFDTWAASNGNTCADFVAKNYCNLDGTAGEGWNSEWGTIEDFESKGITAFEACCACGGGFVPFPEKTIHQGPRPDLACVSWPLDYRNTMNESCDEYAAYEYCTADGKVGTGWKAAWGELKDFDQSVDLTAQHSCCACGGGHDVNRGASLLTEAIKNEADGCFDNVVWVDSSGSSCVDYAIRHWCEDGGIGAGWRPELWGSIEDATDGDGVSAKDVCCACGGGDRPRPIENKKETAATSQDAFLVDNKDASAADAVAVTPVEWGCMDTPLHWADGVGDSCDIYTHNQFCDGTGDVGFGWGKMIGEAEDLHERDTTIKASEACCGCGGGKKAKISPQLESSMFQFCVDASLGWKTAKNETCEQMHRVCNANNVGSYNSGLHHKQQVMDMNKSYVSVDGIPNHLGCCVCGGGTTEHVGLTVYFGQNTNSLLNIKNRRKLIQLEKGIADVVLALFEDGNITHTIFHSMGLLSSSMLAIKFNETRMKELNLHHDCCLKVAKQLSAYRFIFNVGSDKFSISHAHAGVVPMINWKSFANIGRISATPKIDDILIGDKSNHSTVRVEIVVVVLLSILIVATSVVLVRRRLSHYATMTISGRSTDSVITKKPKSLKRNTVSASTIKPAITPRHNDWRISQIQKPSEISQIHQIQKPSDADEDAGYIDVGSPDVGSPSQIGTQLPDFVEELDGTTSMA